MASEALAMVLAVYIYLQCQSEKKKEIVIQHALLHMHQVQDKRVGSCCTAFSQRHLSDRLGGIYRTIGMQKQCRAVARLHKNQVELIHRIP